MAELAEPLRPTLPETPRARAHSPKPDPLLRDRPVLRDRPLLRHAEDSLLVVLALVHGALMAAISVAAPHGALSWATAALIAVGLWWCSNTVSHNHLHNPLFASRVLNRSFSAYLSVLLSVPQTVWKQRHFWHHAGEPREGVRLRLGAQGAIEVLLVFTLWTALLVHDARFTLTVYLPGYLLGLALCQLQGYFEHVGTTDLTAGVSHYGALYNRLWLNDGHHAEHHRRPNVHWTRLPLHRAAVTTVPGFRESPYPPVVRFLERHPGLVGVALTRGLRTLRDALDRLQGEVLGILECMPIALSPVRRAVIAVHRRAFFELLSGIDVQSIQSICIVGGGLFPRTVLVLQELLPGRRLVVVDASAHNLNIAKRKLEREGKMQGVELLHARFDPSVHHGYDLVVVPLAYVGDRASVHRAGTLTAMHDWIWRPRGLRSAVVSRWLFKRINLLGP